MRRKFVIPFIVCLLMLGVTPVYAGKGNMHVLSGMNGCVATAVVSGQQKSQISLSISETAVSLYKGKSKQLHAVVTGTKKKPSWKSSNKSVATVNSKGKVTAKKKGTANITCKVGGSKVTCKITVKNPEKVKVSLNKTKISIPIGLNFTLKATVSGTTQKVKWSSSNRKIAEVNNGTVTAIKTGTVKITGTVAGKKAVCKVTVKKNTAKTEIYDKFLNNPASFNVNWGESLPVTSFAGSKFGLVYLDNDDQPELVVYDIPGWGHVGGYGAVFGCKNNQIKLLGILEDEYGFYEKTGVYYTMFSSTGCSTYEYHKISGDRTEYILCKEVDDFYMTGKPIYTYQIPLRLVLVDNHGTLEYEYKEISKGDFDKKLKALVGQTKKTTPKLYSNTASNRKKVLK